MLKNPKENNQLNLTGNADKVITMTALLIDKYTYSP